MSDELLGAFASSRLGCAGTPELLQIHNYPLIFHPVFLGSFIFTPNYDGRFSFTKEQYTRVVEIT